MTLIWNWPQVLKRAWSIRLTLIASALGAAEFVLPLFMEDPPLDRGVFAALAALVSFSAAIARVVSQPSTREE